MTTFGNKITTLKTRVFSPLGTKIIFITVAAAGLIAAGAVTFVKLTSDDEAEDTASE